MIILNDYGYQEQVYMAPRKPLYDVKISKKDKVLTIESDGSLLAKIGIEFDSATHMLQLIGKDNAFFDEVEMPVAFHSVSNIGYDKNNGEITITFLNTDGSFSDVVLDIDEVVKSYTAGDGIEITDENVINVKVKEGETHLASSEQGLEVNLSDVTETIASLSAETSGKQDALRRYKEDYNGSEAMIDGSVGSVIVMNDKVAIDFGSSTARIQVDGEGVKLNTQGYRRVIYNGNEVATTEQLYYKQDKLVSGENIKTINGESVLGEGNLDVSVDLSDYYNKTEIDDQLHPINEQLLYLGNTVSDHSEDIFNLQTELNGKADVSAFTDYYTKDEVDSITSGKADKSDLEDYYTKDAIDEKILDPYEKELVLDAADKVAQTTQKVKEFLDRDGDISVIPSTIWDVNQGRTYEYYEGEEHRNIYNNLNPGVYKHCNLGRNMDGNHNDETYTVIVKAEFNINTSVYNVQQWAYSENYPSRAFYRIVKTPRLDYYEGDYGPWVQIDHLTDLQNYYRKDETFSRNEAIQILNGLYEEIVSQIPDITGLASEAYVRESINALAALVPTRDQVDEEMQLLSQNLTSYVDEKDMETLNESRAYTNDEIYRTETALNELARKFTRLTDGVKADDPTYTGGTGLFDELYKLFHILIEGMDENNLSPLLPWMKSIENRLVNLEQEIHHQEITGHTKEVFNIPVQREVEDGSTPSIITLTQEHLDALNIDSFETLANVFMVPSSLEELEYGPNRGKMMLYPANETDNVVYAMPTNTDTGYWFDYQGGVATVNNGDVAAKINFANHTIEVANNAETEHVNVDIPTKLALVYNDGSVMHTVVFAMSTNLHYVEPLPILEEGDYYMYNVAGGGWLNAGNDWGTRASIVETPKLVSIYKSGEQYYINAHCRTNNGAQGYVGDDLFVDNPNYTLFTIEAVDYDGNYSIHLGNNPIGYNGVDTRVDVTTEENAVWTMISYDDMMLKMQEEATESNPMDVSFLIRDYNFAPNNQEESAWVGNGDWTAFQKIGDTTFVVEQYYRNFNFGQTISNIPNGKYVFACNGYYRQGNVNVATEHRRNGDETLYSSLYINNTYSGITSIFEGANGDGTLGRQTEFGYIPNSFNDAVDYIVNANAYPQSTVRATVTNGEMAIGIRKDTTVPEDWTAYSNFKLYYLGR